MKILIAEDDIDTAASYKMAIEERNHQVVITDNGEDCLKVYQEELQKVSFKTDPTEHIQPFDAVILDYKMPKINGMEVAKEMLAVNPHQRIIFASAYVKETLVESIKELKQVVELMQKPFGEDALIDTIEDKEIYSELQKLNVNVDDIKAGNFRHEQIRSMLETLRKLQKGRTF
jgi:CheY-like chemotaxis protein